MQLRHGWILLAFSMQIYLRAVLTMWPRDYSSSPSWSGQPQDGTIPSHKGCLVILAFTCLLPPALSCLTEPLWLLNSDIMLHKQWWRWPKGLLQRALNLNLKSSVEVLILPYSSEVFPQAHFLPRSSFPCSRNKANNICLAGLQGQLEGSTVVLHRRCFLRGRDYNPCKL